MTLREDGQLSSQAQKVKSSLVMLQ